MILEEESSYVTVTPETALTLSGAVQLVLALCAVSEAVTDPLPSDAAAVRTTPAQRQVSGVIMGC